MSAAASTPLGLPVPDDADLEALRLARRGSALSPAAYLAYLRALAPLRGDELRRRRLLDGEPFVLAGPAPSSERRSPGRSR